jgi:hypothetical protein
MTRTASGEFSINHIGAGGVTTKFLDARRKGMTTEIPVCCDCRSALITGMYQAFIGFRTIEVDVESRRHIFPQALSPCQRTSNVLAMRSLQIQI